MRLYALVQNSNVRAFRLFSQSFSSASSTHCLIRKCLVGCEPLATESTLLATYLAGMFFWWRLLEIVHLRIISITQYSITLCIYKLYVLHDIPAYPCVLKDLQMVATSWTSAGLTAMAVNTKEKLTSSGSERTATLLPPSEKGSNAVCLQSP